MKSRRRCRLPARPLKTRCAPCSGCNSLSCRWVFTSTNRRGLHFDGFHFPVVYFCRTVSRKILARRSVEFNYQETSKDLLTRIDIHEKYGARDIDRWTTEVLQPKPGMKILDVGCGAGKQCFLYSDFADRKADIIGGDVSSELLERAKAKNSERGDHVKFEVLDFNKRFDFPDNTFDLVSSAF